jgi:hypothetical protein
MLGGYPVDTCWLSQKKHLKNENHVNLLFSVRSLERGVLEVSTTWLRLGQAFTSRTPCSLGNTLHVSHSQIIVFCVWAGGGEGGLGLGLSGAELKKKEILHFIL